MNKTVILSLDSPAIQYLCKKDKRLAKVISKVGPLSYHLHEDPFEFLVHEIIEQMLSIKAGDKIFSRLESLCGTITPKNILKHDSIALRAVGISNSKVKYIQALSKSLNDVAFSFDNLNALSDEDALKSLTSLRGIGSWTAKMYLIFVLDRPDILPYEDGAFRQTYKWVYKTEDISSTAVIKKCKKWKPYSSIAARYMYRALDMGLTKNEFHLHKE